MRKVLALVWFACLVAISSSPANCAEIFTSPEISDGSEGGIFDVSRCADCDDLEWGDRRRFLGMLPSDHAFDRFISPLSNPFYFEDPRSLTEVRGIFINNNLPGFIGGNDVYVYAGQIRGRVSDRLSVIAPRLGYIQTNQGPGSEPTGFMSAPVGFKYNFIRDVDAQFLVSAGATYFIPGTGNPFFQFLDGDAHIFLTAGKEIFDYGHWLSATGIRLPLNTVWGTQMWYWSNQWDYEIADGWYPLVGINWFHWMRSAGAAIAGAGIPVTGLDLINAPALGAGTSVVSCTVGLKWKPNPHVELGSGFEFPLTNRTDILLNRLYVDAILRY